MTDLEMFQYLLQKLDGGKRTEAYQPRSEEVQTENSFALYPEGTTQVVDLRTNGLCFNDEGALVGHWSEYD